MQRSSPTQNDDDLLRFLLGDYDSIGRSAASSSSSSSAMLVERHRAVEEKEEPAVDRLLQSPLTEDAALVVAMFELEAELCGSVSSSAAACVVGAPAMPVKVSAAEEEEGIGKGEEQAAIKEGDGLECHSEDVEIKCRAARRDEEDSTARRTRSAEVHNLCERRRRGRINQRFKALQQLVPGCNDKSDKASILDETIVYMKTLQQQIQMISSGCGITQMMFPAAQTCMLPSAAMCVSNITRPVPATADQVMAGGGSCPAYPSLPYGFFVRGPALTADSSSHQPASYLLFPPAFQSMSMTNFAHSMCAATNQHHEVPNPSSTTSCQNMQVGSSSVNGYRFLRH